MPTPLARWAVGVLIYEMGSGRSPFEARAQLDMFKKISRREFQFPTFFSEGLKEVIDGLLQVDLTQRLGSTYVPACAKTHDARRACGPCTHAPTRGVCGGERSVLEGGNGALRSPRSTHAL